MQKTSLVLIFTPAQYLNAIAYKNQLKKKCKIIVLTSEQRNMLQIAKLDKYKKCFYPLRKFYFLPKDITWLLEAIYVYFLISINKYSEVVIGNYNNVLGFLLALRFQKANKKIVFIDDGLATLQSYTERNKFDVLKSSLLYGGRIPRLLRYISKGDILKEVTFFSIYDLSSLHPPKYDFIIAQNLSCNNVIKPISKELWFIGSPFLEKNLINSEVFNEIISIVKNYAKSDKLEFKYILHRFEEEKQGFNCINFKRPIEEVLNDSDALPAQVVSFYSSGLFNIASMYPNIKCLYINAYKLKILKSKTLKNVYKIFEAHKNLEEFQVNITDF